MRGSGGRFKPIFEKHFLLLSDPDIVPAVDIIGGAAKRKPHFFGSLDRLTAKDPFVTLIIRPLKRPRIAVKESRQAWKETQQRISTVNLSAG
jgi:hypothetical protein